ncbi:unnamed protein product [Symbiodinium sp. CCMP2592]|nr:unnamed protein product [Symbiodinium sp. CCMP2592]
MFKREQRMVRGKQQKASLSRKKQRKASKFVKVRGARNPTRLSAAIYNKLKQADSALANDPNRRDKVNQVYGRLMYLQSRIDELLLAGEEGDASELFELEQERDDTIREFSSRVEGTSRRAAIDSYVPSRRQRWADMDDDDDFDNGHVWDESVVIEASFSDAIEEATEEYSVVQPMPCAEGVRQVHELDTEAPWTSTVTPDELADDLPVLAPNGAKWVVCTDFYTMQKSLLDLPLSTDSQVIMSEVSVFVDDEHDVRVFNPLGVYIGRKTKWRFDGSHFLEFDETGKAKASEKVAASDDTSSGNQKSTKPYYKDNVFTPESTIRARTPLLANLDENGKYNITGDVRDAALKRFLSDDGVFADLSVLYNMPVGCITSQPEWALYEDYRSYGDLQFLEPDDIMPGADGSAIFRHVGHAKALPKAPGNDEPLKPSRRYHSAVAKVMKNATAKIARELERTMSSRTWMWNMLSFRTGRNFKRGTGAVSTVPGANFEEYEGVRLGSVKLPAGLHMTIRF